MHKAEVKSDDLAIKMCLYIRCSYIGFVALHCGYVLVENWL